MKKTNARQALFVAAYLKEPNATAAAIAAGYSVRAAKSAAHRLLKRPAVRAAVDAAMAKVTERAELKAADVLGDIQRLATKAEAAGDYGPAMRGRELLGKHLKLFTEKRELDVGPGLADIIAASFKKPEGQ